MVFENRYVAYIDILAFQSMLSDAKKGIEYIENLLSVFKEKIHENEKDKLSGFDLFEMSMFSDSMVLSVPVKNKLGDNLISLIEKIKFIQYDLFNLGAFIRGGICKGRLYHKKEICFGDAYILAYSIGEKYARYPRIIIDKSIIEQAANNEYNLTYVGDGKCEYSKNQLCNYWKSIVKLDMDGWYYVDYIGQKEDYDVECEYEETLLNIKNIIETNLNNVEYKNKMHIKEKYYWLTNKFNMIIKGTKLEYMKINIDNIIIS